MSNFEQLHATMLNYSAYGASFRGRYFIKKSQSTPSYHIDACSNGVDFKGALSRHFCCFTAKIIQKSFFLTFNLALPLNLGLRHRSIFCEKSNPWYIFGFALKMCTRTLRLNFSKSCNPSRSLPSGTKDSSKKSQCSYLVVSHHFFIFEFQLM